MKALTYFGLELSALQWAKERFDNSVRIAAGCEPADRDGWLEDVAYWREIVARLKDTSAFQREVVKQLERNRELDGAHKKLKQRYREALDLLGDLRLKESHATNALRAVFTNEVIRAIGALARQQHVCREQDGKTVFVTGMEAAREYLIEQVQTALIPSPPSETP